jgi:hypothetical protein
MVTVYLVGGEDIEWGVTDGATVDSTAGYFRSNYARCGMKVISDGSSAPFLVPSTAFSRNYNAFNQTEFWFSARVRHDSGFRLSTNPVFRLVSPDLQPRVQMRLRSAGVGYEVQKIDHTGALTTIGNKIWFEFSHTTIDKIDVHCNYDVAGSLDIYINGLLVFNFLGDLTSDSTTQIGYIDLMTAGYPGTGATWSEMIICDTDTRSVSVQTFAPVANGNTHNFDTGSPAAANVNEIVLDDSTLDGSTTAGQIDQYTNGAAATGTLGVWAFVISARAAKGLSGPSKIALGVRTNGTDYWGSDIPLAVSFANIQEKFYTNPDTSDYWKKSEIGAALGFNIGSKSVT